MAIERQYGCQSMVDEIKRVLLKHPHQSHVSRSTIDDEWQKLFYLDRPDFDRAVAECDSFVALLEQTGMEICYLPQNGKTGLDSIYTHDPIVISNRGAILCQMGKSAREGELYPFTLESIRKVVVSSGS